MERMLILFSAPANPEAFDRVYFEDHVPLVKKLPGLVGYAASRNVRAVAAESPYYMVVELDWADRDTMRECWRSAEGQAVTAHASELHAERLTLTMSPEALLG